MRRAASSLCLLFLLLGGCKKPTTVEIVSFEEGDPMTFEIKTAPKARVEGYDKSTYADEKGMAHLQVPQDKTVAKAGGKGAIYVKVSAARRKDFADMVEFTWPAVLKVSGESVSCGSKLCKGTIDKSGPKVEMELEPGATVELDGQKLPVAGGKISTTVDYGKRARAAPPVVLGKERGTYKFDVPIVITFADKTKLEGKLPRDGELLGFVNTQLGTIDKGPVRFGGETDGPSLNKSIAVYSILGSKVLGPAKTVGEIDLVTSTKSTTRTLSCGTYRGQTTGKIISMDRTLYDEEISVYERKSGKRVGKRAFAAQVPACPTTMGSNESLSGFPDWKAIEAWEKSFLK